MLKAFKYRIKPSKAVEETLQRTLSLCRELYNAALQERRDAYQQRGVSVNYHAQAVQLPDIKRVRPDVATVHSQVLQDVLTRLQRAFENFFCRVKNGETPGYPRFKSQDRYDSFTYVQSGWKLDGDKLWLSKIGPMRIQLSRPIEGTIKTVTIKREAGRWYVIFACEVEARPPAVVTTAIALDVNVENFLTTSEGEVVDNPRWYRKAEKRRQWCQRLVSRKKKGSKRRRKAVLRLQKAQAKVKNQRRDFQHKLSRRLINENDVIFFETLQIKNMVKNHCLAKSLSDVAWGQFLHTVIYKAAEAGKLAIGINPQWTTQECSRCGALVMKGLSQRWHSCPVCGLQLPRDHNSALNILRRGMEPVSADGQSVAARGGLGLPGPLSREPMLGCELVHSHSLPAYS
jgi:putative transposase